jgi:hypothetical protein
MSVFVIPAKAGNGAPNAQSGGLCSPISSGRKATAWLHETPAFAGPTV